MTNLYLISENIDDSGKTKDSWKPVNIESLVTSTTNPGFIVGEQSTASGTIVKTAIDADENLSAGVKQILKDVFDYLVAGGIIVDTDV